MPEISSCASNAVNAGIAGSGCVGGAIVTLASLEVPPVALGSLIVTAGSCFGTGFFGVTTAVSCSDGPSSESSQGGDSVDAAPSGDVCENPVVIEPLPDSASYQSTEADAPTEGGDSVDQDTAPADDDWRNHVVIEPLPDSASYQTQDPPETSPPDDSGDDVSVDAY